MPTVPRQKICCSGQLISDTALSFFSATVGASPQGYLEASGWKRGSRGYAHRIHQTTDLPSSLPLRLGSFSVSMRFRHEIDKCHCCGNRKPSMPGLQPAMLAVLAMSGTVQTSQLREIAGQLSEVAEDTLGALP